MESSTELPRIIGGFLFMLASFAFTLWLLRLGFYGLSSALGQALTDLRTAFTFLRRLTRRNKAKAVPARSNLPKPTPVDERRSLDLTPADSYPQGTYLVPFDRDSVCMGDDTTPHSAHLTFKRDFPISHYLQREQLMHELAGIVEEAGVWEILRLHEGEGKEGDPPPGLYLETRIAVFWQKQPAAQLMVPDFPVSQLGRSVLYGRYCSSGDAEQRYQELLKTDCPPALRKGTPWTDAMKPGWPFYLLARTIE